jgi:hypothetical protein
MVGGIWTWLVEGFRFGNGKRTSFLPLPAGFLRIDSDPHAFFWAEGGREMLEALSPEVWPYGCCCLRTQLARVILGTGWICALGTMVKFTLIGKRYHLTTIPPVFARRPLFSIPLRTTNLFINVAVSVPGALKAYICIRALLLFLYICVRVHIHTQYRTPRWYPALWEGHARLSYIGSHHWVSRLYISASYVAQRRYLGTFRQHPVSGNFATKPLRTN